MDEREPKHRKKKPSDKSKSSSRSDHKHKYTRCIVNWLWFYSFGKRCNVCGRIQTLYNRSSKELMRSEAHGHPSVGLNDYLSVSEMKAKYPGIRVYREYYEGNALKYTEVFK